MQTQHPVLPMLQPPYLLGSGPFATGFITAGASGGCAAAAASFAALICSFLSSLSFSNFICCSSATFWRSIPEPPALVVFLAAFFPACAPLSAELQRKKKGFGFSVDVRAWTWYEKLDTMFLFFHQLPQYHSIKIEGKYYFTFNNQPGTARFDSCTSRIDSLVYHHAVFDHQPVNELVFGNLNIIFLAFF